MKEFDLDFDDAINYYIVKKYEMKSIVSFDGHFDKTDIESRACRRIVKTF